jgi:uncharacterized protein YbaR (Trm112 family)
MTMVDKMLLDILACPACQSDVAEKDGKIVCLNSKCAKKYPIRDGIPVMLVDEGEAFLLEMAGAAGTLWPTVFVLK